MPQFFDRPMPSGIMRKCHLIKMAIVCLVIHTFTVEAFLERILGMLGIGKSASSIQKNINNQRELRIQDATTDSDSRRIYPVSLSSFEDERRIHSESFPAFEDTRWINPESMNDRVPSIYDGNALPDMPTEDLVNILRSAENGIVNTEEPPTSKSRSNLLKFKQWFNRKLFRSVKRGVCKRETRNNNNNNNNNNNDDNTGENTQNDADGGTDLDYEIQCPVCFDDMFKADGIALLICGHLYCKKCAEEIFPHPSAPKRCPNCNTSQSLSELLEFHFPRYGEYSNKKKKKKMSIPIREHPKMYQNPDEVVAAAAEKKSKKITFSKLFRFRRNSIVNNGRYKPRCENKECSAEFSATPDDPIALLKCGHLICNKCFEKLGSADFKECPFCKRINKDPRKVYFPKVIPKIRPTH